MPKSRKKNMKNIKRKGKTNTIDRKCKTKKCIYTDEAKRIMNVMKELRKKNKSRKNKNT
jgi:hypothetical protein